MRRNRPTTAHATTIGKPIHGACATAFTGARHRPSNTPASMALASAAGMALTQRPSGFHSPEATTSAPLRTNAPTAAGKPPSTAPVVASSAAPGVDHAIVTGIRPRNANTMPQPPIATDSTISPDAASACVAPTATKPRTMTANELAKPTKADSTPAATACPDKSFNIEQVYPIIVMRAAAAKRLVNASRRPGRQLITVGTEGSAPAKRRSTKSEVS